jgi:hypothetical protein
MIKKIHIRSIPWPIENFHFSMSSFCFIKRTMHFLNKMTWFFFIFSLIIDDQAPQGFDYQCWIFIYFSLASSTCLMRTLFVTLSTSLQFFLLSLQPSH